MQPSSKKRIAICIVTPWPPQPSGIADYSYQLAASFVRNGYGVTVVTNCPEPQVLPGCVLKYIQSPDDLLHELLQHDMPLFQLGNHPHFHAYMLDAILQLGEKCVVELHDVALHHLIAGSAGERGRDSAYATWLQAKYDKIILEYFISQEILTLDDECTSNYLTYPCSEYIVSDCAGIIVHSEFAKKLLCNAGVKKPIWVIDLVTDINNDILEIERSDAKKIKIGVFGGVQKNRRLDWLIGAIAKLDATLRSAISVEIYGMVDVDCQEYFDLAKNMGLSSIFRLHGRVDAEKFHAGFKACDLCIALRSPTVGETSAVVSKAVRMGIPTFVSNNGWYAELPDPILKIDDANAVDALTEALVRLISQPAEYRLFREKSIHRASTLSDMNIVVDDILAIHSKLQK